MIKISGDALKLIAELSGEKKMQAMQFQALKMTGQQIHDEIAAMPLFKGRSRSVPKMKADEMRCGIKVSIIGGKRGYINRWLNRGTKPHAVRSGMHPGMAGANLFVEDMDKFTESYNRNLSLIIDQL